LRFLIVDDDPCSDSYEKTNGVKDNSVQVKAMKKELRELLSEPILASGVSRKFITSGSRPIVEDLIRGQSMLSSIILMLLILLIFIMIDHDTFLGLKVIAAQDDIAAKRKVKSKARGKKIQASS
jgi:ATP-dependent RNA helicase DDX24/MAK5